MGPYRPDVTTFIIRQLWAGITLEMIILVRNSRNKVFLENLEEYNGVFLIIGK